MGRLGFILLLTLRVACIQSPMRQSDFDIHISNENAEWRVAFDDHWDVLGPFPVHAREQHFIAPGFPLNLSTIPYKHESSQSWYSSYADNGTVGWRKVQSTSDRIDVSFPDIRWQALRASEGWAALQHHTVLRTTLTLTPPLRGIRQTESIRLKVILSQGSFFTILPRESSQDFSGSYVPEWHTGNIYDMERASPNIVDLPSSPSQDMPTSYDLFVSGDYEIRLFGDPTVRGSNVPKLALRLQVEPEYKQNAVIRDPLQDIICDFLDGYAFGNAVGVGIRSIDGWWTVDTVSSSSPGLLAELLHNTRLAPSQTRVVPIRLIQTQPLRDNSIHLNLTLTSSESKQSTKSINVNVELNIRHQPPAAVRATFFLYDLLPTVFPARPPKSDDWSISRPPILALHGAGVDIIAQPFWEQAIPRQDHSWIIMPTGRTSWGLDWHGPSAAEAWATVDALQEILRKQNSSWSVDAKKVLVMGHSNGGQGAWYISSRRPDRVIGVIAAASYLKSQSYIPLTLSRAGHYIDPSLRAILESSLTPDDNDLFLCNLAHTPILAIHGGDDENVPVWHSREYVSVVKTWNADANVTLREDVGQSHWYSHIFRGPDVQEFIDNAMALYAVATQEQWKPFTLTVVNPAESGSLFGWKIEKVVTGGRLARMHVSIDDNTIDIRINNVRQFEVGRLPEMARFLRVNGGQSISLDRAAQGLVAERSRDNVWTLSPMTVEVSASSAGRMQNLLTSRGPLLIVIPRNAPPRLASIALRYAHQIFVYLKMDAEIVMDDEAAEMLSTNQLPRGNILVIGGPENTFGAELLRQRKSEFRFIKDVLHLQNEPLPGNLGLGVLFTHPHPVDAASIVVFMTAADDAAFERAFRLLPLRTGVAVPDWVLISPEADKVGAAGIVGAGVWNVGEEVWDAGSSKWEWNDRMSWLMG